MMRGWPRKNLYRGALRLPRFLPRSNTATLPAQRRKINENILSNWHEKDRLLFGCIPLQRDKAGRKEAIFYENQKVEEIIAKMKK